MAEAEDLEGDPLSLRDVLATGEGFVDHECPLLLLDCGQDAEGLPITVHCMGIGDIGGLVLLAFPATAWHRKVAKRTVPKGFLSKVFAAEVAAMSFSDRSVPLEGQSIRVWLGFCEAQCEQHLVVSDDVPSVPFGELPTGELLVPSVEAVVALYNAQLSAGTPLQTASEGHTEDLAARVFGIEQSLAKLALLPPQPEPASASTRVQQPPKPKAKANWWRQLFQLAFCRAL